MPTAQPCHPGRSMFSRSESKYAVEVSLASSRTAVPERFCTTTALAEQQPRNLRQIPAPNHPRMLPGRFDVGVLDAFALQPFAEVTVHGDQAILCSARNPQ